MSNAIIPSVQSFARSASARWLAALTLFMTASLSAQQATTDLYEDARRYLAEGQRAEAIIQLKNALQANDQHVPSLLLLGDILLDEGITGAASDALSEALLLGADPGLVLPVLADVRLMEGQYQLLIDELLPDQVAGRARAELLGFHALAYLQLGDAARARTCLREASAIDSTARAVGIARVDIALFEADIAEALKVSSDLTVRYPRDDRIFALRGSVLMRAGAFSDALAAFDNSLALNERLMSARVGRAVLQISFGNLIGAESDLLASRALFPGEFKTTFLTAQVFDLQGRNDEALEEYTLAANLLTNFDAERLARDKQLTLMAAVANMRIGGIERARQVLQTYQAKHEADPDTGALLGQVLIKTGHGTLALNVLTPVMTSAPQTVPLLAVYAQAQVAAGEYDAALQTFEKLREHGVAGLDLDALVAVNTILAGDRLTGMAQLERLISEQPARDIELYQLTIAALYGGDARKALPYAMQLVAMQPQNADFQAALGSAYLYNGEHDKARAAFNAAREMDDQNVNFVLGSAETDLAEGRFEQARATLGELAKEHPGNSLVMMHVARIERLQGDLTGARRWAEKAHELAPEGLPQARVFASVLLGLQDKTSAIAVARKLASPSGASLSAKLFFADTLALAGEPERAVSQYKLASRADDITHEQLYLIATTQARLGAYENASATIYRAKRMAPGAVAYKRFAAEMAIALGQPETALRELQTLVLEFPAESWPLALMAQASSSQGEHKTAVDLLAAAVELDPDNVDLRVEQHIAQLNAGSPRAAEDSLKIALARMPGDPVLLFTQSTQLLREERFAEALGVLQTLSDSGSRNEFVLNNLAYVLSALQDPSALSVARQAYALAPESAQVNDTLGWILVQNGEVASGIPYLREAAARRSDNPSVLYHLAKALHLQDRDREASRELDAALRGSVEFAERSEAIALKAALAETVGKSE